MGTFGCVDAMGVHFLSSFRHVYELIILTVVSALGFVLVNRLIGRYKGQFLHAGFFGVDRNKSTEPKLPEAQGVLVGAVFLSIMFLFIPIPFWNYLFNKETLMNTELTEANLSYFKTQLINFLAGLLSICCMVFLGFVDDALNLPWRQKIIFPTIASLPLLMVYLSNNGTTRIVVPIICRSLLGQSIDIGIFYYIYMGMLAVFCTNSINIYAGINGLEVGQSLIITASIIVFNVVELSGCFWRVHLFSLYFLIPFLLVSWALYRFNCYPAKVFVGDTFCYFAGMTFATVGILGHFSKTLLLFFIPQIFNFVYSIPQLFSLIPCPRHRLPWLNESDGCLHQSRVCFHPKSLSRFGEFTLTFLSQLKIVECKVCTPHESTRSQTGSLGVGTSSMGGTGDDQLDSDAKITSNEKEPEEEFVEVTNLTLINCMLRVCGPMNEAVATRRLLWLQIVCSCLAFAIRYPLAWFFYGRQLSH